MPRKSKPKEGETIFWWRATTMGSWASITECKAVYHKLVRWEDHPWSKGMVGKGADFIDEWALWEKSETGVWHGDGRIPHEGQDFAHAVFVKGRMGKVHRTRQSAIDEVVEYFNKRLVTLTRELGAVNTALTKWEDICAKEKQHATKATDTPRRRGDQAQAARDRAQEQAPAKRRRAAVSG